MLFFDSHAHYNDEKFERDREEILLSLQEEQIGNVIVAGYNAEASKQAVLLAKAHPFLYATCGISPNDIENFENQWGKIQALASEEKIVAIGEIGLDYYWNKDNKEKQKEAFRRQIELANQVNKPIVIHTREATIDTITMLKETIEAKKRGVFHCCPLNTELIKAGLSLGFYISFAGPVTFKNAKNADECIKLVPMDKLLIETDSPYLSPEPHRGKRNDSRNVKYIAEKIAQVKQMELEQVAAITYQNAKTIFEIKA